MPGTKFMKQSDLTTEPLRCFDTELSSAYSDMFHGQKTTADISDMPYKQGLFLEIPTSDTPNYGSGEVIGYQIGLYVNSITGKDVPQIAIWKSKKGITDNVGTFGTSVVKDIYSMSSFVSDGTVSQVWETNFGGAVKQGTYVSHGYQTVTIETGPYATTQSAWDKWESKSLSQQDFASFKAKYASVLGDAASTSVVFLELKMDSLEGDIGDAVGTIAHNIINSNGILAGVADAYAEYHWYVKGKVGLPWDGTNDPSWRAGGDFADADSDLQVDYNYSVSERLGAQREGPDMPINTANIDNIDGTHANEQLVARLESSGVVQPLFKSGWFWEENAVYSGTKAIRADLFGYPHISPSTSDIPVSNSEYSGFMQAAAFHKSGIVPGIIMTKDSEQNSSTANSTSNSNRTRQKMVITCKIKKMSEVVAKDATANGASFPSRGMAIWFKNRLVEDYTTATYKYNWNLAEDILHHHYDGDIADFEAATTGLAGINNSPFCGFIMYRYNGEYYIKSICPNAGVAGFMYNEAESTSSLTPANTGGQFPHFNFDPNSTSDTYGAVKLVNNPTGRWLQFHLVFNPRGSGFDLNVVDAQSGNLLINTVSCWSSQASSSCNETTSWNHFSCAAYGCTSLGTLDGVGSYQGKAGNVNFRPNFTCLTTPATDSEQYKLDNSVSSTEIIFDHAFITKGGFNYKHINSTLSGQTSMAPGKLGIAHRTAIDNSGHYNAGVSLQTIEESTGETPATFWSFGTKTKAEIVPPSNAVPKYLYFNGFEPLNASGLSDMQGIDSRYMKWAWTTATPKLGMQLWGVNNAGSASDDGTVGESMFTHGGVSGINRIFFDSTSIETEREDNPILTSILSNEYFSQKGHVAYLTTDIADAASMNSTIVKRENIFCSARVLATPGQVGYRTSVDTLKFLRSKTDVDEEYIMFIHGARNAPTNYVTGLKLINIENSVVGAGTVAWQKKCLFSDAQRTLRSTPLGTIGADASVGTDEKISWVAAGNIKLSDGTQIVLEDYFNVGDKIEVAVSGSVKEVESSDHIITEIGALYLKIGTVQSGAQTITDGTLSIMKVMSIRDFLLNRDSQNIDVRYDDAQRVFVSPHRYWLFAEIFNYAYDSGLGEPTKLPDKAFNSVVITDLKPQGSDEDGSTDFTSANLGATWNEWRVTDGYPNQRIWNMTRDATTNQVLLTDTDFGYGAYVHQNDQGTEENAGTGGYVQKHIPELTIEGNPQTNIIDISGITAHKEYKPKESIYMWINMLTQDSDSNVNVSTFDNATTGHRPFLLTVFHDERPDAPVLSVAPYEKDAYLPEYEWKASGDDLWYGLLHIDTKNIASQYHNALWRLPLDEDLTGYEKSSYNKLIKMYGADNSRTKLYDYGSATTASIKVNNQSGVITGSVVVDATAKTITITGTSNLNDFISSPNKISITGMLNAGNNLTGLAINSISTTVIGVSAATTLVNETRAGGYVHVYNDSSKTITFGVTSPSDLTRFFKADDKFELHHGSNNSVHASYGTPYTVATVGVNDSGSSFITTDEELVGMVIQSSAGQTIKNVAPPPDDRYDGLAGHTRSFVSANKNVLSFTAGGTVPLMAPAGKFSLSCHLTGANHTISGTEYILYQRANDFSGSYDYNYYIAVNSGGNIVLSVQGYTSSSDTDAVSTLTSASIMPTDGETPMHIAFTLDSELSAQNLKLFINGVLEASTGMANDVGSSNTTANWSRDLQISGTTDYLFVGAKNQSGQDGFNGSIEEIVAYSDVIYPVNPKDSKFLWTKPTEDFLGTGSSIAPASYTARLFIKDFHNIRGASASQVATSSMVSFRKPVFDLRGA